MSKSKINDTRAKKSFINMNAGIVNGLVTIIFTFIISKVIIDKFGDEYNGFINLIGNMIAYVVIFDAGIGIVMSKKLYPFLRNSDMQNIYNVYSSAKKVFKKIGMLMLLVAIAISIILPNAINTGGLSHGELIIISLLIMLRTIINYFILMPNKVLIESSQRADIILWINTIISLIVFPIIMLLTLFENGLVLIMITWLLLPITIASLTMIWRKKIFNFTALKQNNEFQFKDQVKDILPHNISGIILANTDVLIISIFATLSVASKYSIYMFLVSGVLVLARPIINSVVHSFGDLINNDERPDLEYDTYLFLSMLIAIIFGTGIAIVGSSFIGIIFGESYSDNKVALLFGVFAFFSIFRTPTGNMINVKAMFKETKYLAIGEMLLNIILSLIFINTLFVGREIEGVLWATIIALTIRTIIDNIFVNRNIVGSKIYIKNLIISAIWILISFIIVHFINIDSIIDIEAGMEKLIIDTVLAMAYLLLIAIPIIVINKSQFKLLVKLFKGVLK